MNMTNLIIRIILTIGTFIIGIFGVFVLVNKSKPTSSLVPPINDQFDISQLSIPQSESETIVNSNQQSKVNFQLERQNPDGWFSLLIPTNGIVERPADVDGGYLINEALEIRYNYWTYENTPNWLRDIGGNYSESPNLACSQKSQNVRTRKTRINGERAVIQQCSETDERKGFRYIYYVTFPKIKVFNGEDFDSGMFNLTIEYKDSGYLLMAERTARSIRFEK